MINIFKPKSPLDKLHLARKDYLLQKGIPEYLRHNLQADLPGKNSNLKSLDLFVVDFETTGFDPSQCDIISIGWIEIKNGLIDFSTRQHFYIKNKAQINSNTAVINHIVPQMTEDGLSIDKAIETLLTAAKGKILVAHGKVIEKNFLDSYFERSFDLPSLPLPWLDTLKIEKWRELEKGIQLKQDHRLSSARERYNLPQYAAHNAMIDAIATAELLLAQTSHIFKHEKHLFDKTYKIAQ